MSRLESNVSAANYKHLRWSHLGTLAIVLALHVLGFEVLQMSLLVDRKQDSHESPEITFIEPLVQLDTPEAATPPEPPVLNFPSTAIDPPEAPTITLPLGATVPDSLRRYIACSLPEETPRPPEERAWCFQARMELLDDMGDAQRLTREERQLARRLAREKAAQDFKEKLPCFLFARSNALTLANMHCADGAP